MFLNKSLEGFFFQKTFQNEEHLFSDHGFERWQAALLIELCWVNSQSTLLTVFNALCCYLCTAGIAQNYYFRRNMCSVRVGCDSNYDWCSQLIPTIRSLPNDDGGNDQMVEIFFMNFRLLFQIVTTFRKCRSWATGYRLQDVSRPHRSWQSIAFYKGFDHTWLCTLSDYHPNQTTRLSRSKATQIIIIAVLNV